MWLARPMQICFVRRILIGSFRLFSPSAAVGRGDAPAPPPGPDHFMVDYLVSSCGFPRVRALWVSRYFTHLKSHEKPDAVLHLLRQGGLGDEQIRIAVSKYPRVLLFKPDKTLAPKMKALHGAGFSGSQVGELISLNPRILCIRELPHRLEFWRKLVGTNEKVLKVVKVVSRILSYSLDGRVVPRLSLLRDLGVPDDKMGKLIVRKPRWLYERLDWINAHVEQAKSLGFTPGSPRYMNAFQYIGTLSRSNIDAKSKLLRSYGWTQAELLSAIHLFPVIMNYSEKKLHATMSFLLNEAGCEPSYVARRPALLGLSIEKRLMPRNFVLQSLKKRGLSSSIKDCWTTMKLSEDKFVQKLLVPYKEQLPELFEAYHAILSSPVKTQH